MNRAELVRVIQASVNSTGKGYFNLDESAGILDAVIDAFTKSLAVDQQLTLRGFGSFTVREYPGRQVPNPQGGDVPIEVQAYKSTTFKASGLLKDKLNGRSEA